MTADITPRDFPTAHKKPNEITENDRLSVDWSKVHLVDLLPGSGADNDGLPRLEVSSKHAPEKPVAWTIMLDVSSNFGPDLGGPTHSKRELQEVARLTKDRPVTIVAQLAVPIGTSDKDHRSPQSRNERPKYELERYVVKNGRIDKVDVVPNSGFAKDLAAFVTWATANHPAEKLALSIQAHGEGNPGLVADTGPATTNEFIGAVTNGLRGSGHSQLDMFALDACLEGQNGVIEKIRGLTDHLVASPEIQGGFNMSGPLQSLLKNPQMDGDTLADEVVKANRDNDRTPVLAHYALRHQKAFQEQLDRFGDSLCQAVRNPSNRNIIDGIADSSAKLGDCEENGILGVNLFPDKTDIRSFASKILAAIKDGSLKDPGDLKSSGEEVLAKLKPLVKTHYGIDRYKDVLLSVFLPVRNFDNLSKSTAPISRLVDSTQGKCPDSEALRIWAKHYIEFKLDQIHRPLTGRNSRDTTGKDLSLLFDAGKKLQQTEPTAPDFPDRIKAVHDAAKLATESRYYTLQLTGFRKQEVDEARRSFINELKDEPDGGWKRFQQALGVGLH